MLAGHPDLAHIAASLESGPLAKHADLDLIRELDLLRHKSQDRRGGDTSVKYGEVKVEDYTNAAAEQREKYGAHSGKQLGDPAKLGQALLRLVAADEPPLRYAAGSDAVRLTREALEKRLAELDRWQELSETTDSDDAKAA